MKPVIKMAEDTEHVENSEVNYCKVCEKTVSDSDKAVMCDLCDTWRHIECEKITNKQYNKISGYDSNIVSWFCGKCKLRLKSFKNDFLSGDRRKKKNQ